MKSVGAESELDLVRRLQQGIENAWNEFYSQYVGLVRSIVRRKAWGPEHEMEDLVQSVFVELIDSIGGFQTAGSLSGFVGIVAERTCLQEYRKRTAVKRDAVTDSIEHHEQRIEGMENPGHENSPETDLSQRQTMQALKYALDKIGENCRDLLRLRFFDELSYKEISEMMATTENTLTVRVRRCLDRLAVVYGEITQEGM